MIFLTGDVHEMAAGIIDQRHLSKGWTEVRICEGYLELANSHAIRPTLFFTGRAVEMEGGLIRSLLRRYEFEVGGHDYAVNRHRIIRGVSRRFLGLANGTYGLQKTDMSATIKCILDNLGVPVSSWRNHAYRMDRNTYKIAGELGLQCVSNKVTEANGSICRVNGVLEVPINTLPDHESLGHGIHRRAYSSAKEWVDQVLRQMERQRLDGIPSIILAHPLCMFIEDNFAAFEYLCKAIAGERTAQMNECRDSHAQYTCADHARTFPA